MNVSPRVSIVILGYNEKPYLQSCISAVLDQDYPEDRYEILYVDNCSTDGSADWVLEHFPKVRVVRLFKNYGFGGGNNRGAAEARGSLVAFLNSDTVAHRSWLSGMVHALDADPLVKACVSGSIAPDLPGFDPSRRNTTLPPRVFYGDVVRFGHVGLNSIRSDAPPRPLLHLEGCSAIVDLSILNELEYLFDETYFLDGDDTDLGFRINSLGYKVVVAPQSLFYHLAKNLPGELKPNRRVLRRMVNMHRNRFVTYYRNMHTTEFILSLPILLAASALKPFTFNIKPVRRLAYALAIIPVTWYAFIMAVVTRFPAQSAKRKHILQRRRLGHYWFFNELLRRKHYST